MGFGILAVVGRCEQVFVAKCGGFRNGLAVTPGLQVVVTGKEDVDTRLRRAEGLKVPAARSAVGKAPEG